MRLHKDIIHVCGRNFKSGKQRGAMKGGMGENRAYHTLDMPSAGKVSRKKSPQKALRSLRSPQNAQEEGVASHIAANAPASGKMPKMHDF